MQRGTGGHLRLGCGGSVASSPCTDCVRLQVERSREMFKALSKYEMAHFVILGMGR